MSQRQLSRRDLLKHTGQTAGGIGGLLAWVNTYGTVTTADDEQYWYTYDANGNVGQLLDATDIQSISSVAHYEYDPYGQTIIASGPYANSNPFRFSTKWFDTEQAATSQRGAIGESGLGYWGYRFYSANLGRWLNRDPIGEKGGINLYVYVANGPSNAVDFTGLWGTSDHFDWTLNAGWSLVGPACAWAIAGHNVGTDSGATGPVLGDFRYHFDVDWLGLPKEGARDEARAIEKKRIADGIAKSNCQDILMGIGRLIHIAQDVFSHQAGGQQATDGSGPHDAATPAQHIGCFPGTLIPNPLNPNFGFENWGRPDDAGLFPADARLARQAAEAIISSYQKLLLSCPCFCRLEGQS